MYNIGVIGGGNADEKYRAMSIELGKLLAERKVTVFCGGTTGVMEWVAQGVKESHGVIVGILPAMDMSTGNGYLTVKMPTGLGFARNVLIVRASESLISVDGSTGTLSEATFALSEGKSVIVLGELPIERRKKEDGMVFRASSPQEAVEIAMEEAAKIREKILSGWRLPGT